MKRKFTLLAAALMLLSCLAIPLGMRGQGTTATQTSFNALYGNVDNDANVSFRAYRGGGTSTPYIPTGTNAIRLYQISNSAYVGSYVVIGVADGYKITSATIQSTSATTAGYKLTDTNPNTSNQSTSTTIIEDFNVDNYSLAANTDYTVSGISTQYITFGNFGTDSNNRLNLSKISITYEAEGNLNSSDLTITDAPVVLDFDLYNNSAAQTVSYITSSTGNITITPESPTSYFSYVHNAASKTITVTPLAVTPSTQTVTISQAADDDYAAGSVSFTVNISDSTPFEGGDVTFTCGTDVSESMTLSKNGVSMVFEESGGTWNRTDNYRLYSGKSLTISTTSGTITQVAFTISQNNFSGEGYNSTTKTWTGNAQTLTLDADGGQVRFTPVVVTVTPEAAVATPVITVPATFVGSTTATITCETTGATIYYSYDNSTWTEYTAALTITQTTTIYAKAVNGTDVSTVVSATTTRELPVPTVIISDAGINNTDVYVNTAAGSLAATVNYSDAVISGATVTWSGDNDDVATIDASTGAVTLVAAGTVNFTATFAGNADYNSASATHQMTVTSSAPYEQPTTVEVDLNNTFFGCPAFTQWSSSYEDEYSGTQDNVTITLDKGTSSSMYINTGGIRLYQGNTLTFAAPSGYNITRIVLTGASGFSTNLSATEGDLDNGTWTGSASSVEITGKTGSNNMTKATITLALPAVAYTITYADNLTNGAFASTGNPTSAYEGDNVTVTTTPAPGYHLFRMTYNGNEATLSGNTGSFTMPGNDVTMSAEFVQDATYTITYSENGITIEDEVTEGPIGSSLFTTPFGDNPANLDFVGWSTSAISTYMETAPTLVDETYNVSSNVTFYAVYKYDYSYTEGGGTPTWTKVTDASTLAAGDQLVIASDDAATLKAAGEVSSGYMAAEDADSESVFTIPNSAVILTLGGVADAWTLSNNNRLLGSASGSVKWNDGVTTWNISISGGNATIGLSSNTAMRFLYNVSYTRFKTYSSAANTTMILPQLYRLEGGSTTVSGTYYLTSVTVHSTDVEVSNATTWTGNHSVDALVTITSTGKLTVDGLLISPDEDAITIQNGGQLVTSSKGVAATVEKNITGRNNKDGAWNFIASPVSSAIDPSAAGLITDNHGSDATTETAIYDLYYYDEPNHLWKNYRQNTFNLNNGKGYLYANKADVNLTMAGTLNNTDGEVDLSSNDDTSLQGWNLVGNPFPCNATITTKPFYFMVGGILVAQTSSTVIAPCKGVLVQAGTIDIDFENNKINSIVYTDPAGSVTFSKVTTSSNPAPQVNQLQMTVAQQMFSKGENQSMVEDNAIVSFNEGNYLEKFVFNAEASKLYIPQAGMDFAIVSSEGQGEMPVNFRAAKNGTYTLTVNPEGVEMNYLHLIDNMTGMDVDLLQTPSYSFEARTNDYESRFRLVFASGSVFGDEDSANASFAFYSNGNWIINNAGEATLQVIDINGRILSSERVNGSVSKAINGTAGVYMLRLINGENVKVQKVVVR